MPTRRKRARTENITCTISGAFIFISATHCRQKTSFPKNAPNAPNIPTPRIPLCARKARQAKPLQKPLQKLTLSICHHAGNSNSYKKRPNAIHVILGPEMSSRNAIDAHATLQDNWIKLLRTRRGPSAPLLKCPYCHDQPTFTDENDLWHHVKKTHSVHIPRDESRVKRFRDEVLAKSRALSKYVGLNPRGNSDLGDIKFVICDICDTVLIS